METMLKSMDALLRQLHNELSDAGGCIQRWTSPIKNMYCGNISFQYWNKDVHESHVSHIRLPGTRHSATKCWHKYSQYAVRRFITTVYRKTVLKEQNQIWCNINPLKGKGAFQNFIAADTSFFPAQWDVCPHCIDRQEFTLELYSG